MSRPLRFQFRDDLDRLAAETEGVVDVPAGIEDKQELMQFFARSVPLPDYFGGNWDALDECFRDRLSDHRRGTLCMLHRDLPLGQDKHDGTDYLTLLDDTLVWAEETAICKFNVIFPTAAASKIEQLIDRRDDS